MGKQHTYRSTIEWTGNKGQGTKTYSGYERSHVWRTNGKPDLLLSSDPAFRGDVSRQNPEELLLAALSSCHLLSYLHVCTVAGVIVTGYTDLAEGIMEETPDGGGHFTEVTLHIEVTVAEASMIEKANELHEKAHHLCFIANSVNFLVKHTSTATGG